MRKDTFTKLWDLYVNQWFNISVGDKKISELCHLKKDARDVVFENYNTVKRHCKKVYFLTGNENDVTLNRYKRASAMAYAVLISDPLKVHDLQDGAVDEHFLKQNLAFYLGTITILMDFKKEVVQNKKVFKLIKAIGTDDVGNDTFIQGIYKDFLFAELYHNYDILAVAYIYYFLFEYTLGFKKDDVVSDVVNGHDQETV